MEDVLGEALSRGVKIVTNAGGLNPAGLATAIRTLSDKLGLNAKILHIEGDDVLPCLGDLQAAGNELKHLDTGRPLRELKAKPLTANAYLGAWGIVEALNQGADVVVCPRVTDASVVVGPAAWKFGWTRDDWDRLAGAVAAGHIIECGTQCTGGNYSFFREVPGLERPGFPIAEIHEDGSSVITKHERTGGLVSVGTVTAQLLYEIDGPKYANPDVVARFDTVELEQVGPDRVLVSGVRGEPAPAEMKVCLNYLGGFSNQITFVLTGLDIEEKAALVERTLRQSIDVGQFDAFEIQLARTDKPKAEDNQQAAAFLKVTAKSQDPKKVGRAFTAPVIEMALASYPGFFCTTPPQEASPLAVYWPTLIPAGAVEQCVVLEDGTRIAVPPIATFDHDKSNGTANNPVAHFDAQPLSGTNHNIPLGTLFGARSGDKGGNANVGIWARDSAGFAWLREFLTIESLRGLLPEAQEMEIRRYEFSNLNALNFVVVGLLGEGVASSTRFDPQAKSLGEFLRSRIVPIPQSLLAGAAKS